jgi:tripartite-type tricarboxylate transporter receptor subunit TctC
MNISNRRLLVSLMGSWLVPSLHPPALAQSSPSNDKSIRLVVGFAPGGAVDSVARVISVGMSEQLNQNMIVENRVGASANIAALNVVQSPPDGLTVLMGAFVHSVNPSLIRLGYEISELKPLLQLTRVPTVLLVNKDSPYKTVTELVRGGKSNPKGLTFSSGGSGTASHLAPELFARKVGIKSLHIPYKGGLLAMQALMAGEVDFMCENPQPTLMAPGSRVRALAVFQPSRTMFLPDVPSIVEAGYSDELTIRSWHGLFVRNTTPEIICNNLVKAAQDTLMKPNIKAQINAMAIETVESNPELFSKFFTSEIQKWRQLIKDTGIRYD